MISKLLKIDGTRDNLIASPPAVSPGELDESLLCRYRCTRRPPRVVIGLQEGVFAAT